MGIIDTIKQMRDRKAILKLDDYTLDQRIKIQGTQHDRKRKLADWEIKRLREYFNAGLSVKQIADIFDLNYTTVRYNVDDTWRSEYNAKRSGAHTGTDHITFADRVAYKRALVSSRRIKV